MYTLSYHPDVRDKDLPLIPQNMRDRIRKAIEERLLVDPIHFGDALRKSLHGFRKMRVGDYRVIHKITGSTIVILMIRHRKDVYKKRIRIVQH